MIYWLKYFDILTKRLWYTCTYHVYIMDILYINNVYVNYIVPEIFWYTHQNIVIYWLKYFDMLCLCFVRDIQPQDWTLCCWSSSFSECQDRLPIRRGNIHLLSMCTSTVAAIPCCSFFPRNWLSWLQTTCLIQNFLITYTLHMLCILHVYFVYILIIYQN